MSINEGTDLYKLDLG